MPTCRLAIGADSAAARSTSACASLSAGTSLVTIWLNALVWERTTSRVRRSILRSATDSSRPNEAPWISGRGWPAGSVTVHTYCWWLWPLNTTSTLAETWVAMVVAGPGVVRQSSGPPPSVLSPWCSSTAMLFTPTRSSRSAYLLMAATSSPNFSPLMASADTTVGSSSSGTPMMPIGTPPEKVMVNGRVAGTPLSKVMLAAR